MRHSILKLCTGKIGSAFSFAILFVKNQGDWSSLLCITDHYFTINEEVLEEVKIKFYLHIGVCEFFLLSPRIYMILLCLMETQMKFIPKSEVASSLLVETLYAFYFHYPKNLTHLMAVCSHNHAISIFRTF